MIVFITDIAKQQIAELQWVSQSNGVVTALRVRDRILPFAVNPSPDQCANPSELIPITPHTDHSGIIWMEDLGTIPDVPINSRPMYITTFRVIGWLNGNRFNLPFGERSARAVQNIIAKLKGTYTADPIAGLKFNVRSIPEKHPSLFAKWGFDDVSGYMTYPHDYFAIEINARYTMNADCVADLEAVNNDCP